MTEKRFQRRLNRIKKRGERYKKEAELKASYAEYLPERKKRKVSNIMLVVLVIAVVSYTTANLWITYRTGISIDPTLTTCFYAFWGSEALFLAGLKTSKIVTKYDSNAQG